VLLARNPVYAAMNLVAAFFFMAGIYVLLTAHLIAFMQILVYAGAVMVLFLFVIMLLSLGDEHLRRERRGAMQYVGAIGAISLLAVLASAIARVPDKAMGALAQPDRFGTVKAVGQVLYTDFLLPFEVTSLLLLVAIVGAVVVAKERI
jgi:NADH-quinone oxidoreductase subunit J